MLCALQVSTAFGVNAFRISSTTFSVPDYFSTNKQLFIIPSEFFLNLVLRGHVTCHLSTKLCKNALLFQRILPFASST